MYRLAFRVADVAKLSISQINGKEGIKENSRKEYAQRYG